MNLTVDPRHQISENVRSVLCRGSWLGSSTAKAAFAPQTHCAPPVLMDTFLHWSPALPSFSDPVPTFATEAKAQVGHLPLRKPRKNSIKFQAEW